MSAENPEGVALQLLAVIRVGDADQGRGALADDQPGALVEQLSRPPGRGDGTLLAA